MSTAPRLDLNLRTQCTLDVYDFESAAKVGMLADSLANGGTGLPFFRQEQVAAQISPTQLLERYSLRAGWHIQRPDSVTVVARTSESFAIIIATGTPQHCTMSFRLWAATQGAADDLARYLLSEIAGCRITDNLFRLEWRFLTSQGLRRAVTMERPQDILVDEAYPTLSSGVSSFIQGYLDSPESVLVLRGPPGTGKTRLVRALLSEISMRKKGHSDEHAAALYSGDKAVWESDEIFVEFITGEYDALLIEDADHLITPRSNGNQSLHRFLNISDGVAQAQGRKIIFSTNLPSVRDLDEALVRPGRCYAHIHMRHLERDEAKCLLRRLCGNDSHGLAEACAALDRTGRRTLSVADVYTTQRGAVPDARTESTKATAAERSQPDLQQDRPSRVSFALPET